MTRSSTLLRLTASLMLTTSLCACGNTFSRLSEIGEPPKVSPVENPATRQPPVSMPMPTPVPLAQNANSLWRAGARAFLKDGRAAQVGDIVTVVLNSADTVNMSDNTVRKRTTTDSANSKNLLGYETSPAGVAGGIWSKLPGAQGAIDPANLLNYGGSTDEEGLGTIQRTDTVALRVAAVVTQVLPNGNLVIQGSQEIRVNFETRVVQVGGVIRQSDIASDNTITHDKIAEARFIYGGRGQLTDVQQPRWGTQLLDVLFPF